MFPHTTLTPEEATFRITPESVQEFLALCKEFDAVTGKERFETPPAVCVCVFPPASSAVVKWLVNQTEMDENIENLKRAISNKKNLTTA